MIGVARSSFSILAGVAGAMFLGYCIYFDKQRRSDPDYKRKVRERRQMKKRMAEEAMIHGMPNLNEQMGIEEYFVHEIKMGETYISRGDFERGVTHLANAIVVCGQPDRLLQVMQNSLPFSVFSMLLIKMQECGLRAASVNELARGIGHRVAGLGSGPVGLSRDTSSGHSIDSSSIDDLE